MNELDKEINIKIMQELGLEPNSDKQIIDQDTGMPIAINGMPVVAPGCYGGKNSIEFDPYNNKKMMNKFFGFFLDKYSCENDVDVLAYYNIDGQDNTGSIECRLDDDSTLISKNYRRDSLKYTDIIMQLNGDTNIDLNKYDIAEKVPSVRACRGGHR